MVDDSKSARDLGRGPQFRTTVGFLFIALRPAPAGAARPASTRAWHPHPYRDLGKDEDATREQMVGNRIIGIHGCSTFEGAYGQFAFAFFLQDFAHQDV